MDAPNLAHKEIIKQVALIEISNYFEPVADTPPTGLKVEDCEYKLTITEISDQMLLILKGPKISLYADSKLKDLDGFKQALFRIILKEKPEEKEKICRTHGALLPDNCTKSITSASETAPIKSTNEVSELVWQKEETGRMSWKKAVDYCSKLSLDNYSNWRLPNKDELEKLTGIQNQFPELDKYYYWSSTLAKDNRDYAWGYNVNTSSLFNDGWIKNRYSVKCVRDKNGSQSTDILSKESKPLPVVEESREETTFATETIGEETTDNSLGWRFVVAPTYMAGFYDVIDIYIANVEEKGEIEDRSYITVAIAFIPYYQLDTGLRLGAGIGPSAILEIDENNETVDFMMTPININAGYTFDSGLYLRGGLSLLNASGDFVASESLGLLGAIGLEIRRKKMISFGFEAGFDSASVELEKYDCSSTTNVTSLSNCDKSKETVYPIGLMASFHVIF